MDRDSHLLFEAYGKSQVAQDFEGNNLKVGDEVEFKTKKPDETVSSGKITKIYGTGKGAVIEVVVQDEYGNLVYKMYGDDALINNSREDKMSFGYGEGEITGYAQYIGRKSIQGENAEDTKIAKIHSKDVWELNPPLKATESRWPDANLTSKGEMKQFPVTVEYLHLQRNQDGSFDAIDAEDPSRSTVINLPLPQGFNPKASFEEVLKALGYTVTEKDGQTQLGLGENAEETDDQEYEDELDKKEAYKANLLRSNKSEDAEERALDAIGNKPMSREEARQIADKYTNWSHEELIKMSSAYNNGFNHELQGIADDNEYKEGTLNYYMYQFGQYEALTSH